MDCESNIISHDIDKAGEFKDCFPSLYEKGDGNKCEFMGGGYQRLTKLFWCN